jgi:NAD(P)-dependent dehydrogenase (short-subunit alcohol dehydrogenase family)
MTRRLEGKVAVVTGGADGMGKATARRFVQEGARVVIADVQEEKGAQVADELGDSARFVRCDVREEDDVAATVGVAVGHYGGLDIMQHFAATAGTQLSIDEMSVDEWDASQAILVRASMLVIKQAVPAMRVRGGGCVTLTSSAVAYLAKATNSAAYVTGKGAVVTLARIAALQYATDFIRINVIVPGAFSTPITLRGLGYSADMADKLVPHLEDLLYGKYQPLPRAGMTQDIASAALFLASDEASFITGADLRVDGGMSLQQPVGRTDLFQAIREAEVRAGVTPTVAADAS